MVIVLPYDPALYFASNYLVEKCIILHTPIIAKYGRGAKVGQLGWIVYNEYITERNFMAKHRSWHGADIKRARKKKLKAEKKKRQIV